MTTPSDAAEAPVIEMRQIERVFYTDELQTHAVDHVDLTVKHGEFIALSGPSGCGKSSLLAIMGLLDRATAGEYLLRGEPVDELSLRERARLRNLEIGFIFQNFNLLGDLTVEANVALPLSYQGNLNATERRELSMAALERVGMTHRARHLPAQLSGGQQQRVAVARALAGSPSILLADEPTGNLDSRNGDQVMHLLRELHAEGSTICMVTHDTRFAREAARVVHMLDGRVVQEDEYERMLAETR